MANQEHLKLLVSNPQLRNEHWNEWRRQHLTIRPDLSGADLSEFYLVGANLSGANLSGANLSGANLSEANLSGADLRGINVRKTYFEDADLSGADLSHTYLSSVYLSGANLSGANLSGTNLKSAFPADANFSKADLSGADLSHNGFLRRTNFSQANLKNANLKESYFKETNLSGADLSGADLRGKGLKVAILKGAVFKETVLSDEDLSGKDLSGANLSGADLSGADLTGADLSGADLSGANLYRTLLVETNLRKANLTQCTIYGISAWNVKLEGATQNSLIITPPGEPTITIDNLKIAQFLYLLLNNPEIRNVIDTIARKAVLILGRFTPERKAVLDALREALRTHDYVPILFDFDRPSSRNVTETVKTLAHLSRFIIADLTDPSSIPYELAQIVPGLAIPVQPVLLEGRRAFAMFSDLPRTYHWVLPTYFYTDQAHLLATLQEHVIVPAEQKAQELEKR